MYQCRSVHARTRERKTTRGCKRSYPAHACLSRLTPLFLCGVARRPPRRVVLKPRSAVRHFNCRTPQTAVSVKMKWPLAAVLVGTARSPATGFHVNPIPVRSTTTVAAAAGVEQSSRITACRYSRPSRHRVAAARASAAAGLGGAADGVESSLQHLTQPGEGDEDEDEGAFFSAEESLPPTIPPAPARAAPAQAAATEVSYVAIGRSRGVLCVIRNKRE